MCASVCACTRKLTCMMHVCAHVCVHGGVSQGYQATLSYLGKNFKIYLLNVCPATVFAILQFLRSRHPISVYG